VSVPAAYLGIIVIWSTTPLAIKWSSEGLGPWLGVSARMLIGVFVCLVMVALMSRRMRWHSKALSTYVAAGLGVWGAMSTAYWASQFIPSGMISVVYGFTPVMTGVLAAIWLAERAFTRFRTLGMALGIAGLLLIFGHSLELNGDATQGLFVMLLSVFIHSTSAIWVKRIDSGLHPLETTTGALLVSLPLFFVSWLFLDGQPPQETDMRAVWSVLYLGAIASSLGFAMYFYVLREVAASRVALITLLSPVLALMLGNQLNGEQVSDADLFGTAIILLGLVSYQWGEGMLRHIQRV